MINKTRLAILGAAVLALSATGLAMQSGSAGASKEIFRTHEQSAVRIYDFEGTPMRFDTSTGAIHALQGNAAARGTVGHWSPRVPAVASSGPGMFEIQRPAATGMDGVFLVEQGTGETWLLRWSGNKQGVWHPLNVS